MSAFSFFVNTYLESQESLCLKGFLISNTYPNIYPNTYLNTYLDTYLIMIRGLGQKCAPVIRTTLSFNP
jgi:hypothetical protein